MKWPKGIPTRPEVEQGVGGTPPTEFEADRARLLSVLERFRGDSMDLSVIHPFFGALTLRSGCAGGICTPTIICGNLAGRTQSALTITANRDGRPAKNFTSAKAITARQKAHTPHHPRTCHA